MDKKNNGLLIVGILAVAVYVLTKANPRVATYSSGPGGTNVVIPGVGSYSTGPLGTTITSPLISQLFNGLLTRNGGTPAALATQAPAPLYDPSTAGLPDAVGQSDIIAAPDPYTVDTSSAVSAGDVTPVDTSDPLLASAFMPALGAGDSVMGLV